MAIKPIWPQAFVKIGVLDGLIDIILTKNHWGSHVIKAGVCLFLGVDACRHQLLLSCFDNVGQLFLQICGPHDCIISIFFYNGLDYGGARTQLCHPLYQWVEVLPVLCPMKLFEFLEILPSKFIEIQGVWKGLLGYQILILVPYFLGFAWSQTLPIERLSLAIGDVCS